MAALDGVGVLHDAQKSRLAGVAFDTLRQCILGQITIGCSKPQYRRAVAGIGAMRAQALTHSQVHSFNAFMTDQIKAFQTGRHRAMWDMLLTELVTLISTAESADSAVSVEEAASYLEEVTLQATQGAVAVSAEDEDLFGGMA
ncbi:Ku C terminal domain like-domain-containing protein [Ochromonadaceae sp. CCMP2298]|nr:Ku C terminal domain like-domain-containing protein [Ochromonadaceae sp. CCMP2298]